MAIEKMQMLSLSFDKAHLDDVLDKVKDEKHFYPQRARSIVNNVKGVVTIEANTKVKQALDQVEALAKAINLDLTNAPAYKLEGEYVEKTLGDIADKINKVAHNKDELVKEKEEDEHAYHLLDGMSHTNLNFDELMNCKYLTTRIGRIRKRNEDKLDYYKSEMCMFLKLGESRKHIYCMYVATNGHHLMVDNVFSSMGFKEIEIPTFVHGTIEEAKHELKDQIEGMEKYINKADEKLSTIRELHSDELRKIYGYLAHTQAIEDNKSFVVDYSSRYAVYGFIPERYVGEMESHYPTGQVEFKTYPADIYEDRGLIAPTLTYNPVIVKPFEGIAKVKQQDHVDMSAAFAALYLLVFFLLVGDIGVGAVLLVLGLLMHKSKKGPLFTELGLASLLGGLLYGTCFYSHLYSLINFEDPIHRIINAILIIIIGTYCLNTVKVIYNEKSMANKVFSMKGIVGIIIVLMIGASIALSFDFGIAVHFVPLIVIIVIGVLLIMVKNAVKKKNV
jgi:vacuolar-type H+-ATPase subunit I/STV1